MTINSIASWALLRLRVLTVGRSAAATCQMRVLPYEPQPAHLLTLPVYCQTPDRCTLQPLTPRGAPTSKGACR